MYFHRHCTTVVDHYYAREKAIFIPFPLPNITKESSKAFNRSFMHDFLFRFFGYPITSLLPATLKSSKEKYEKILHSSTPRKKKDKLPIALSNVLKGVRCTLLR